LPHLCPHDRQDLLSQAVEDLVEKRAEEDVWRCILNVALLFASVVASTALCPPMLPHVIPVEIGERR